jgi:hypothetical protein
MDFDNINDEERSARHVDYWLDLCEDNLKAILPYPCLIMK